MIETILNYIGGEFVPALDGEFLDNVNPATGKVYSKVPNSKANDVASAVKAAQTALPSWSALPATERAQYLQKISELILKELDALALAETIDNGKPISVSKTVDIPRSAENFSFFAEAIREFKSEEFDERGKGRNTVHYTPVGVVGCISPWNLPLYLFTWKVAPALAAGCTVVAKPSEVTPMTAFLLGKICQQAGLPPGVLNIVHGLGQNVGAAISRDPNIKAISFTGSTATGKLIAQDAAQTMKRLHLEMGGKNANIIFADCDFEKTVDTTVRSSFANQGQICLCGSRIFVERAIYEKFKLALIQKVKALRQGDPTDPSTQQGAVVSKLHFEKVMSCIKRSETEGVFYIKSELKGKVSREDVLNATEAVAAALEILDSRYEGFKYFSMEDVIADNSSSSHYILGPKFTDFKNIDLRNLTMQMKVDGHTVMEGNSREISDDPVISVIQLAELLAQRGKSIPAGTFVLAGAATVAIALKPGMVVSLDVESLPNLSVTIKE